MKYSKLSDEEIIKAYRNGDLEAVDFMLRKYTPLIYKSHNNRYAAGCNRDDFIQEGFIGLLSAINQYDVESGASFYTFAKTCINNSMNKLIQKSLQKKNQILNNSASLEEEQQLSEDVLADPARIVLSKMINEDTFDEVENVLSKGELDVYRLLREGYSTSEIADILDKDVKSVDNSIQRIKSKARKLN
ncbi:MAG: sigma-70 family RNA polymerase sigma factor [Lachnospiraceae bacterium]|nr:sigma-70 family RNA polymerase sigma factor [Lachnospiraceae bacterium]